MKIFSKAYFTKLFAVFSVTLLGYSQLSLGHDVVGSLPSEGAILTTTLPTTPPTIYKYDSSILGNFSCLEADFLNSFIHDYLLVNECLPFLSTCHELRKYERIRSGLVNSDQLDVPWYQLHFETSFDKAHFNFAIFKLLDAFHRSLDIENEFTYDDNMEYRIRLVGGECQKIKKELNSHLNNKLKYFSEIVISLVDEARSRYCVTHSQQWITKEIGFDWFEKKEAHPITLLCQWFVHYINLPDKDKTSYGYGCDGMSVQQKLQNSNILLEYTSIMEKLFKKRDSQFGSLYGLHAYIFFIHSGDLTNDGCALVDKPQDIMTRVFGGDLDRTPIFGYEPGIAGWLYHPVFKDLIRKTAKMTPVSDAYHNFEERCLHMADDFMDRMMILDTCKKIMPKKTENEVDEKIIKTAHRANRRFEHNFPFAKPILIKSIFNVDRFEFMVKILSDPIFDQFTQNTVDDQDFYNRYLVWSLLCLGRNDEARDKMEQLTMNLREESPASQVYNYVRCLVDPTQYREAIIRLSSFRILEEEHEAYRIWCYAQLGEPGDDDQQDVLHFTQKFLKQYPQAVLDYHKAHFDRDKEILTKAMSTVKVTERNV